MAENKDPTHSFEALRQQAEELIRHQTGAALEKPPDILDLIHELRIHQAELEIQNEELQRAQQEISDLHQEYLNLYEFAPCGYLTLNHKGIITRLNLTGSRLLDTPRNLVSSVGFSQSIGPGWEDAYFSARAESAKTGQKQRVELPVKRKNGPPLWVQAEIEASLNDAGEVIEWRMVLFDISEKKKAVEAKENAQAQLRHASKMEAVGTLAGGIAHEINNMLGIIIGNAELAMDELPESNPAAEAVQEIQTASLRVKEVVRKLLHAARTAITPRQPVQIRLVVEDTLDFFRKSNSEAIDIRFHLACTTEQILADPAEIHQVLLHLCTNSVQAMIDGKGVLTVALEPETLTPGSVARFENIDPGAYVKLTVSDDGTGILPENLERIFDPYFTTRDIDEGLGMGLAVVHGIVKKHDGAIRIDSEFGKGTAVEVLFPLIHEPRISDMTVFDCG